MWFRDMWLPTNSGEIKCSLRFCLKCIFKFFVLSFCLSLSIYFSCVECFGRVAPDESITHPPLLPWAWGEGIKHMFPFLRGSTRCFSIPISELTQCPALIFYSDFSQIWCDRCLVTAGICAWPDKHESSNYCHYFEGWIKNRTICTSKVAAHTAE